ncbi:MAG: hypothetical protein LHW64_07350 [Candidatus Cloacimonetes bacterium]|jgi:arsenate reductase-like glutaredoxin family protein|nr:hypothetical protein [Candidatus Cloacimonadota bacterium]MCB5287604.1 hypothetical protein [Candidatus Cloacimonadota bacterium]MCK9185660.1 hypothetical protein [Candidatus Cloacimonadota bacterium]MCK9584762.1 hypothetical protein [Candidatus Cloacimonadota bacterium]MDY0229926.1 hypothetical protein [Candidatus Cloacimonadaceae bacterium]
MKTLEPSWTPTVTLAKLFEEQNQFFDALATYELIAQTDASPAIREKIEDLHARILNDPSNRYDPRIEKLFTPEELAYLKILSHQGFDNMSSTMQKLGEGLQESQIIFDEEDILAEESELDALSAVLEEIEKQAQLSLISSNESFSELTVGDLLLAVLSRYDKNQLLSEIQLSDLVSLFVDLQNPKS